MPFRHVIAAASRTSEVDALREREAMQAALEVLWGRDLTPSEADALRRVLEQAHSSGTLVTAGFVAGSINSGYASAGR